MNHNCVRCGKTAGFWVSTGGVTRRPWCLACIGKHLDPSTVTITKIR